MFVGFTHRQRSVEWMDEPDADPALLDESLRFIRRVNRWLRYTRSTISHLQRFSRSWTPGQTIRILDVATGTGDVPVALVHWGEERGFDLRVVAIDLQDRTLSAARRLVRDPRIEFLRADALRMPFDDRAFDYAICSLFLHHLSDDDAAAALREMDRVSRRGLIAGDLLRQRRAYAWIYLLTTLANPMARNDARASVRQAFSRAEAIALADRAGLHYLRYHRHFAHRFILAGEKTSAR